MLRSFQMFLCRSAVLKTSPSGGCRSLINHSKLDFLAVPTDILVQEASSDKFGVEAVAGGLVHGLVMLMVLASSKFLATYTCRDSRFPPQKVLHSPRVVICTRGDPNHHSTATHHVQGEGSELWTTASGDVSNFCSGGCPQWEALFQNLLLF